MDDTMTAIIHELTETAMLRLEIERLTTALAAANHRNSELLTWQLRAKAAVRAWRATCGAYTDTDTPRCGYCRAVGELIDVVEGAKND